MTIKTKITLTVGLMLSIAFLVATLVIYQRSSQVTQKLSFDVVEHTARQNGLTIQLELDLILEKARVLKTTFKEMLDAKKTDRDLVDKILIAAVEDDKDVLGTWTLWEPNAFDGLDEQYKNTMGHDETGRVNSYWHWDDNNQEIIVEPNVDWETSDYYQVPRENGFETLLDPYVYKVSGKDMLLISAIMPVVDNGQFLGVVGVDYELSILQRKALAARIFDTGHTALIANGGMYVANINPYYVGKNISEIGDDLGAKQIIAEGRQFSTTTFSEILNQDIYKIYVPLQIGNTDTPWSLVMTVPLSEIMHPSKMLTETILAIGLISLLAILILLSIIVSYLIKPLSYISEYLEQVTASGSFLHSNNTIPIKTHDEIGKLATAFNTMFEELRGKEAALKTSEERFNLAMRGANDGLWDWHLAKEQIYLSPRWKSMLGYEDHELDNNLATWNSLLHPDDRGAAFEAVQNYLDKKIPVYEQIFRMKHKKGHDVWILSRGFGLWGENGEAARFIGTHVDISAQKQVEEDLRKSKEAADVANQAKSTFLANMSHELRTPLNGILGYAQILGRDVDLTEKQKEGTQIIQRSGEYLLTLINDILDLSKIEANRIELYPTDFNFNDFLQSIVELFQIRAEQKGISFMFEPITTLPLGVRADEKRLRQTLINLLANAIKFTEHGGVILKVGCEDGKMRFQVEDTGVGISEQDLQHIFKPFQQAGSSEHKAEGTGLGLTITKRIIDMMGGELHVRSTKGQGSCFWITLALPEASNLVKAHQTQTPYQHILGYKGKRHTLLVIDDKKENRMVLNSLLSPLDFNIIEAENGLEGLDMVQAHRPDLVMTDLVMPKLDGFELSRRLRTMPEFQTLPIIVVSASVFDYHQEQSFAAGCSAFIPKPVHADVLFTYLQEYLNLEWIYGAEDIESDQALDATISSNNDETDLTNEWTLSAEQANQLYDLAMQGDMMGLSEYVDELSKEDASLAFFAKQVKTLANNFEDDRILELVKPFAEDCPC
ncbi:ATP-binding protein [Candidatus Albibeggiatoa sp. nov. NOAA]|uniref:ATP-binding protein n=1 Tax=Candidatus Albibeggiatoa sp. nov. NOAA TaxID=3162724 RepID=UPI0032F29912|nr:ATP-binding protein [Thiotrichaceae bacterium]